MAKVYGDWWGGHSYARTIEIDDHLEVFDSIRDAMRALENRYNSNGHWRQTFNYANGRVDRHYCSTVGRESYIDIYLYDPRDGDNGPDRRVCFGPRGGVRVEYR